MDNGQWTIDNGSVEMLFPNGQLTMGQWQRYAPSLPITASPRPRVFPLSLLLPRIADRGKRSPKIGMGVISLLSGGKGQRYGSLGASILQLTGL